MTNKVERITNIVYFFFYASESNHSKQKADVMTKHLINSAFINEGGIDMLISKDANPTESLIYIAGCILTILKSEKKTYPPELLYDELISSYQLDITFIQFCLALDFLFLLDKIEVENEVLKYVY